MMTASWNVLGSNANGIDDFLASSVVVVVVKGTSPPQQWLSVMYSPVFPQDSTKKGSAHPSGGPTSMTRVGRGVSDEAFGHRRWLFQQSASHLDTNSKSSPESPALRGNGLPLTPPCQAAGSSDMTMSGWRYILTHQVTRIPGNAYRSTTPLSASWWSGCIVGSASASSSSLSLTEGISPVVMTLMWSRLDASPEPPHATREIWRPGYDSETCKRTARLISFRPLTPVPCSSASQKNSHSWQLFSIDCWSARYEGWCGCIWSRKGPRILRSEMLLQCSQSGMMITTRSDSVGARGHGDWSCEVAGDQSAADPDEEDVFFR